MRPAHVVADPRAAADPWLEAAVDWEATLAFRRHLWRLGLGVAEAMDTAQRGMGLDWPASLELIRRTVAESRTVAGAAVVCGAGTDHLAPAPGRTLDEVAAAYEEQCAAVEAAGGRIVLMASRALAAAARGPDDYPRRLWPRPGADRRPGGDPLAGRGVRPRPRRLLGAWRPLAGDGGLPGHARRQRDADRRDQDLAARQGQGGRDAPPPAGGGAHVYRRRFRLSPS